MRVGKRLREAARPVREGMLASFRRMGGFRRVAASAWRRRQLLILCYHGVSLRDEHEWHGELFATPHFLRRRFEILRDGGYTVLPLGEAVRCLRRGTLPPRSVVLTFDDGFYNFRAAALPLLEEFGFPATNYVSTYYCIHQHPVPIISLRYLLWHARSKVLGPGVLPGQETPVDLRSTNERDKLAASLLRGVRSESGTREAEQALLREVAARLGVDWEGIVQARLFHLMNTAELAEIARRGIDVQLHTHRHRAPRERGAFVEEVLKNRRILEERTGRAATHFCYPSGDVDPVFLPWLRELSVETATTTAIAGLAKADHDPLVLPRYTDTMEQSEVLFEGWLSGAGALLHRRRR